MQKDAIPIKELIRILSEYPNRYTIRGYEGEFSGMVIENDNDKEVLLIHNDGRLQKR